MLIISVTAVMPMTLFLMAQSGSFGDNEFVSMKKH